MTRINPKDLKFKPVTAAEWADLVSLFGSRGACGGCWCMSWRVSRADFDAHKGESNKRSLKKLVDKNQVPGILAYIGNEPVGWCSVAPREEFIRLEQHRTLKRIDEQPVWSVVCLFVAKPYRNCGVSVGLLKAAAKYAQSRGAKIIEGYPTEPSKRLPDPFVWTGLVSAFQSAGFEEVARPAATRPIMRLILR
jgi:GNAT superfamily N-acetyltransferase